MGRNIFRRNRFGAAAAVLSIVLAGTGAAFASIPAQGTNTISACYVKKTGTMRLIDTDAGQRCSKVETLITWNVAGQKGDTGPAGAVGQTGATGPQGTPGLSAYQVAVSNGFSGNETQWLASLAGPAGKTHGLTGMFTYANDVGPDAALLGTIPMSAGTWVIIATAYAEGGNPGNDLGKSWAGCDILGPMNVGPSGLVQLDRYEPATFPLTGGITLSEPGTVRVYCSGNPSVRLGWVSWSAIRVDELG